jgi:hypothetical protein
VGETASKDKLGVKLFPESGEDIAVFNCGESHADLNPYTWRGSVIVPIAANSLVTKELLAFRQRHVQGEEEQKPATSLAKCPDPLEGTSNFERLNGERVFLVMGWQMSTHLVNEEALANSVL